MASLSRAAVETQELVADWERRAAAPADVWYVVPSAAGQRLFRQRGWRGFRDALAPWAAAEAMDLERMQVVATIPTDTTDPLARPIDPELVAIAGRGQTGLDITLHVPYELAIFRGHFSTVPIVPGAMLVGWAAALAASYGQWPHGVGRAAAIKFRRIVQPGPQYTLRLDWTTDQTCLEFAVKSVVGTHAAGSLLAPAV